MKAHDLGAVLATIGADEINLSPAGDELLHVLEGELDLCVLAGEGRAELHLRAGSVFIVPRGLWHRSSPRGAVSMLFATPAEGGQESWADDPLA
jgi:quercetin dioxygenase-like cupin family protein